MLTVFLIGLSLSMDALSVSVTNGLCIKNIKIKQALLIALFFGFFQFLMPLIGFFAASLFGEYIEVVDHWIAFILLMFIGIKMILEARETKGCNDCLKVLSIKILTLQAIATSIDALAVGVGLGALKVPLLSSCIMIGIITFVLCFMGVFIGKKAGDIFKGKAEILGGIILIGIGLKILIEHLFFA